jgi:hypothetical protein
MKIEAIWKLEKQYHFILQSVLNKIKERLIAAPVLFRLEEKKANEIEVASAGHYRKRISNKCEHKNKASSIIVGL